MRVDLNGIVGLGVVCKGNGGSAVELRDCITKVLVARFVGVADAPPRGPDHPESIYKCDLLRRCLPPTDEGRRRFLALMDELTGDIREEAITLRIVGGSADAFDIQAWASRVPTLLCPSAIETFPRHRWVNSLSSICQVALLTVHGVLVPAVLMFLRDRCAGGSVAPVLPAGSGAWGLSSESEQ